MKTILLAAATAAGVLSSTALLVNCNRQNADGTRPPEAMAALRGRETATMAAAPAVPPAPARNHATRVHLDIEIQEHTGMLADGAPYTYWTFGDRTPGPFLRVREGDMVETRISNHPDNTVAHNIDFQGATGPGGGSDASFVAPGRSVTFAWRAMRPGLYLYHCSAEPAGQHIANGMYGLILIDPKEGLGPVDREYYLVQGEFYTTGKFGERGPQQFSLEKAMKEQPEYVVFNGEVGALTGSRALRANVGERIRLYVGNAGPSLVSSFHVVGEIFDRVYLWGGTQVTQSNVQTTLVPVGGSVMVEFTADVPGEYQLMDHAMFRAHNKGAIATLRVDGPSNQAVFAGKLFEEPYQPKTRLEQLALGPGGPRPAGAAAGPEPDGQRIYGAICATCHQPDGKGVPGIFPPLAKSDFLMADKLRAIRIVQNGLKGEVVVNGQTYRGEMPKPNLNDAEIAAVLSYVRANFGNAGDAVTLAEVTEARSAEPAEEAPKQMVSSVDAE